MPSPAYTIAAQQIVSPAPIYFGQIVAGSPVALCIRVTDDTGATVAANAVAAISAVVTDMMADTVGSTITIDPTATMLSLTAWTVDAVGYNARVRLDGSNFPLAATTYQVIITFTTTTGAFKAVWQLQTQNTL